MGKNKIEGVINFDMENHIGYSEGELTNFNIKAGDTSRLLVTISKKDHLVDLTDYLMSFEVTKTYGEKTLVLSKDSSEGGGIEKDELGKLKIKLESSDTKDLLTGTYNYEIKAFKSECNHTYTMGCGKITFFDKCDPDHTICYTAKFGIC